MLGVDRDIVDQGFGTSKEKRLKAEHGRLRTRREMESSPWNAPIAASAFRLVAMLLLDYDWNPVARRTWTLNERTPIVAGIGPVLQTPELQPIAANGVQPYPSAVRATELRKLPREQQAAILGAAAEIAASWYRSDPDLTDFEAFAEEP